MKELPVGRQVFENIRKENLLYVDKTARITDMVRSSKNLYFLSRPRRFGKTLLCSTLNAIFDGKRELFEGLTIATDGWTWEKHPVIRLDMSRGSFSASPETCGKEINNILLLEARKLGVELQGDALSSKLNWLIVNARAKYGAPAVVLIDEYDNPLLSVIDKPESFAAVRDILHDFYKVVKSAEENLRFTFITGVTKFSQASVFSALNNLNDITLDPRFCDLCGITQEELERDFADYIGKWAGDYGGRDAYLARLKNYYNGYRFSENPLAVYNPFGLLRHFDNGRFQPYWFESGSPSYLLKLIKQQKVDILDMGETTVTTADFRKYDLDSLGIIPLLYQSGYLTVKDYERESDTYRLDYPNTEVRSAFANELSEFCLHVPDAAKSALLVSLPRWLYRGDLESAIEKGIRPFMAAIPYDLAIRREKYFQTVFHILFNMLGLICRSEVAVATGRIDSIVETPEYVYCFEFKLDGTADEALAQIDGKGYLTPWTGCGKTLVKVGVSFDYEKRAIAEWKAAPPLG
jgi:hypothetical protein